MCDKAPTDWDTRAVAAVGTAHHRIRTRTQVVPARKTLCCLTAAMLDPIAQRARAFDQMAKKHRMTPPPLTPDQKMKHADTMFRTGHTYMASAATFADKIRAQLPVDDGPEWAWLQLWCQGIEVCLKGVLLFKNYDHFEPELKKLHHDIFKVARAALVAFGLSPMRPEVAKELKFISKLYAKESLRYGVFFDPTLDPRSIPSDRVVRKMIAAVRLAYRERNREAKRLKTQALFKLLDA